MHDWWNYCGNDEDGLIGVLKSLSRLTKRPHPAGCAYTAISTNNLSSVGWSTTGSSTDIGCDQRTIILRCSRGTYIVDTSRSPTMQRIRRNRPEHKKKRVSDQISLFLVLTGTPDAAVRSRWQAPRAGTSSLVHGTVGRRQSQLARSPARGPRLNHHCCNVHVLRVINKYSSIH
jgi:hypothetical protein